jgi:hypothetical protein
VIQESDSARFKLLYDLGCGFAARTELDELLPFIIANCRDALNADGASLLFLDRDRNEFYFPYFSGSDSGATTLLAGVRFSADQGFAGVALKSGPLAQDRPRAERCASFPRCRSKDRADYP